MQIIKDIETAIMKYTNILITSFDYHLDKENYIARL